jgi:hypothetical protein
MPSLLCISTWLFLCTVTTAVKPTVKLDYTSYEGKPLPNGISQWLGIRYAAPPLGDLRFAAPVDPPHNTTIQKANEVSSKFSSVTRIFCRRCELIEIYSTASYAWRQERVQPVKLHLKIAYSLMSTLQAMPPPNLNCLSSSSFKVVDLIKTRMPTLMVVA